ncbi:hypothetical protein BDQ12DRAFT_668632 [Crucibulum laeve]|uniref:Uncharacterized protein n=1 Tax=Crucibulum laeve TaxID=68775 RepID=A0A5C3LRU0_9AGAR|nr:hypothetical protein BDQ12DRAFT_668632 [Crucibulum laeve]
MKNSRMYEVQAGKFQEVKTPVVMVSNHILEAQTVVKAIYDDGNTHKYVLLNMRQPIFTHKSSRIIVKGKFRKIKEVLNSDTNLVMVPGNINIAKGRFTNAVLRGYVKICAKIERWCIPVNTHVFDLREKITMKMKRKEKTLTSIYGIHYDIITGYNHKEKDLDKCKEYMAATQSRGIRVAAMIDLIHGLIIMGSLWYRRAN